MWSVAQLCRCAHPLRAVQGRLLVSSGRNGVNGMCGSRQLITPARNSHKLGNTYKGIRISEAIKSSGIVVRLCSTSPKPKTSKAVGYWLLGCSGMVFTAVVLGMVTGYITLLYTVCYVINVALTRTNGSK